MKFLTILGSENQHSTPLVVGVDPAGGDLALAA